MSQDETADPKPGSKTSEYSLVRWGMGLPAGAALLAEATGNLPDFLRSEAVAINGLWAVALVASAYIVSRGLAKWGR